MRGAALLYFAGVPPQSPAELVIVTEQAGRSRAGPNEFAGRHENATAMPITLEATLMETALGMVTMKSPGSTMYAGSHGVKCCLAGSGWPLVLETAADPL